MDAGPVDAGPVDAGPVDAGTPDGGPPDAGPDDAGVDAGLFCDDWACVLAGWPPEPLDAGSRLFSLISDVDAGVPPGPYGMLGWFGGVLLPTGKVLAVPHRADHVLEIDPVALTARPIGPTLTDPAERKWAGAVLSREGVVFALPYDASRILRIDPADGGVALWGPDLRTPDAGPGLGPLYAGGVLDAFGYLWAVPGNEWLPYPIIRVDLATGAVQPFFTLARHGGWWGMARLPDDRLVSFPKDFLANGSHWVLEITPRASFDSATVQVRLDFDAEDAGLSLQGSALTRDGVVLSVPSFRQGAGLRYDSADGGISTFPLPAVACGTIGTHGDGFVYSTPDEDLKVLRLASDGGVVAFTSPFGTLNDRYGWLGFVATRAGLVGIPSNRPEVLILNPGVAESRSLEVLLSPYFNKL